MLFGSLTMRECKCDLYNYRESLFLFLAVFAVRNYRQVVVMKRLADTMTSKSLKPATRQETQFVPPVSRRR
jgi:hypothetical protein